MVCLEVDKKAVKWVVVMVDQMVVLSVVSMVAVLAVY